MKQRKEDTLMTLCSAAARRGLRPLVRLALGATLTVFALSLFAGCGPPVGEVRGKVYHKGKVVTSGFVTVVGIDGLPKQSEIAEDGSFRVQKVPLGEVTIVVTSPPLEKKNAPRQRPTRVDPETGKPIAATETPELGTEYQRKTWRELPLHYSDITKSKLNYSVTGPVNTYEIKLE
jgi:hypothetical protein